MPILTASYNFPIKGICSVQWPENVPVNFELCINEFKASIVLERDVDGCITEVDGIKVDNLSAIRVEVSRDEVAPLPLYVDGQERSVFVSALRQYINNRKSSFDSVSLDVLNRVIRFFRYRLQVCQLQEINRTHSAILNPEWYDEGKNKIEPKFVTSQLSIKYRILSKYDVTPLSPGFPEMFSRFINTESSKSTLEDIMVDALGALNSGDLRRAVLELAIATEVMVKKNSVSER